MKLARTYRAYSRSFTGKTLILLHGFSKKTPVAVKAGVPQSTIARIENLSHGLPKLTTLKKIADALDSRLIIKLQTKKAG